MTQLNEQEKNRARYPRQRDQHVQRPGGRKERVKLEKLNRAAMVEAWCPVNRER